MTDYILVLNRNSGLVHRKYHAAHGYQPIEGCNLDDTTAEQEITRDEFAAMAPSVACRNCMGEDDGSTQPEMVS